MQNFAFYNTGCERTSGIKAGLVLLRRGLRRILRPMFFHQERISVDFQLQIDDLRKQLDDQRDQTVSVMALGWDYVAMARRLALLEDQVERLHEKLGTNDQSQEWNALIPLHRYQVNQGMDRSERAAAEG